MKLPAHRAGLPGKEAICFLLRPLSPPTRRGLRAALPVKGDPFACFRQKSAHLVFDQPADFSLIGKSLSLNILFGVNQLAVTLYIEDTASAFDQFNI